MSNSITYKEHLNTGNYSWKEFEHTIMLTDGDDVEQKTLELMNFVKRMIGFDESKKELDRLESRIEELKEERKSLLRQIKELKEKYEPGLTPDSFNTNTENSEPEPEPDDIPFDNSTFEGGDF